MKKTRGRGRDPADSPNISVATGIVGSRGAATPRPVNHKRMARLIREATAVLKVWQISAQPFPPGVAYHFHTGSDAPSHGNVDADTADRPNILNASPC